jgi:heme exporter protein C
VKKILYPAVAAAAAALLCWTIWSVFYGTPLQYTAEAPSQSLFFNQKIFYWHVPHAMLLFALVFVCGIASAGYLKNRKGSWDDWAVASGELAVVYGAIVLATGSIWGKAAWHVWWQWDMRLTTSLLLWTVMVGYVLVRRFGGASAERLAAGLAVFGMIDVPLIYYSVKIWNTVHPKAEVVQTLDPAMRPTFYLSFLAIALVLSLVLLLRVHVAAGERSVRELRERAIDADLLDDE